MPTAGRKGLLKAYVTGSYDVYFMAAARRDTSSAMMAVLNIHIDVDRIDTINITIFVATLRMAPLYWGSAPASGRCGRGHPDKTN